MIYLLTSMKMISLSMFDESMVIGFSFVVGYVLRIKRIFFLILSKVGGSFRKTTLSAPIGTANKNIYILLGLRISVLVSTC
jgi:hypothetical protein